MDEMQPLSDSSDLQEKFRWLHRQIQIILVLLILVSGTLTLFLLRQYREAKGGLQNANQMVAQYTNAAPAMDEFVKKVVDYARTHPDLAQALTKYGINATPLPPSNQPQPPKK